MRCLSVLALAVISAIPARTATLFTTLGPGGSFSSLRYGIDGVYQAFSFEVSAPATLDSVSVAVSHQAPPVQATVRLYEGTALSLGTLLESFPSTITSTSGTLLTVASSLHPLLQPGPRYWLAVEESGPADLVYLGWYFTGQPTLFGTFLYSNGAGAGYFGAFQVDGTPTPEPAMTALILCGLLAIGSTRLRSRM